MNFLYTKLLLLKPLEAPAVGTPEAVDAVTASQVRIVADLSNLDLSTGSRTVPVKVYLDGSSEVGVVGEYNISISVSRS